jgi:hypothetical protein
MVASVTFDRAFPHTLAVSVVPERPVAVLRQGADSWLASARGRVLATLEHGARPVLPRVWLGKGASISVGALLDGDPAAAVRAVAPLADRTLPLSRRLGEGDRRRADADPPLWPRGAAGRRHTAARELAIAARIVPSLPEEDAYLDVAVPKRPVAGPTLDSQVDPETEPSTRLESCG